MRHSLLFLLFISPILLLARQAPDLRAPLFFEKAYLHTDRDTYLQGDTIWFKAYLVNPQDGKLGVTSRNLYVELVSSEAKIMASALIRLDNGVGHGDIEPGDDLPPGTYRLRAYTNWMRNFGDNFVFEKLIDIAGGGAHVTAPAASSPGVKKPPKAIVAARPLDPGSRSPLISFYPEGGSLVEGIISRVAVKARDVKGNGIVASCTVLSSRGDSVTSFTTDSLGFGLLAIQPEKGQSYRAILQGSIDRPVFQLPAALAGGPAMLIRQTDSLIRVVVSIAGDTATGPAYTLQVKHGGKALFSKSFTSSARVSIVIPSYLLPEGISAITLYDENDKPACERLVYSHRPDTSRYRIATDKNSYSPGERVTVNIGSAPGAHLSMAVVDAGAVPVQESDIVSYLELESELRGRIAQPSRYFDTTNVDRFKELDLLLMTQGWRNFVWRRMADTLIHIGYRPEDGVTIAGKVKIEEGRVLPGMNVSLYASAAKGIKLFSTKTDSLGRFYFPGVEYYGNQPVKLLATNGKGEKKGTFYLDTMVRLRVTAAPEKIIGGSQPADSIRRERFAQEVTRRRALFPAPKDNIALKEIKVSTSRRVSVRNGLFTTWGADQVFNITAADKEFKTLEWYLLQHAKGAQKSFIRDTTGVVFPGSDTLRYVPAFGRPFYRLKSKLLPPILFVNGREIFTDDNAVAEEYRAIYYNMPIGRFKQITVRKAAGTLPHASNPQAASIVVDRYLLYLTLTEEALLGDNPGVINLALNGYDEPRSFYEPLSGEQAIKTGYRATVYWMPDIRLGDSGKFTTSFFAAGQKGKQRVVVQGVTTAGRPVSILTGYEVR